MEGCDSLADEVVGAVIRRASRLKSCLLSSDTKNQIELFSGAILVQRTMTQSGLWQMFIQSMFIERYTLKYGKGSYKISVRQV